MVTISIDNLIGLLTLITAWAGSLAGAFAWATGRIKRGEDALHGRIDSAKKERDGQIASIERDLAAYKLEVSKTYASNVGMKETEERLLNGIDRLTDEVAKMRETFLDVITALRIPPAPTGHQKQL